MPLWKFRVDFDKLRADWAEDPQLKYLALNSVEELAAHLRKCHDEMMGGAGGCYGYLYRQQTLRARELMNEQSKRKTSGW